MKPCLLKNESCNAADYFAIEGNRDIFSISGFYQNSQSLLRL
jgi:hypothetical protein